MNHHSHQDYVCASFITITLVIFESNVQYCFILYLWFFLTLSQKQQQNFNERQGGYATVLNKADVESW